MASRWTPGGIQREVEEPTTVLVVGEDETDEAHLSMGECSQALSLSLGFRPFVDAFVVALYVRPGPDAIVALLERVPAVTPTAATNQNFLRDPTGAPDTAAFVSRAGVTAGPAIGYASPVGAGGNPLWTYFPGTGLHVGSTSILWVSLATGLAPGNFGVMWRST